ncbi:hypothetical protein HCUR_01292 [Holospora curviuscula]|uniref:Uncharacterized protein n=1 Tax=Holospora curviuscula TaxID=1082868 RepID=A0A2S5R7F4_9PROT|nr:hypothetical protein HCUR_01292 [Holospora curviuscula]
MAAHIDKNRQITLYDRNFTIEQVPNEARLSEQILYYDSNEVFFRGSD